jgi:hypothetical protein
MPRSDFQKTLIGTVLGLALGSACVAGSPARAGTDQLWYLGGNGDGKINTSIVNIKDGRCVNAENYTAANGTPAIVYQCLDYGDELEYAQSWNERWRANPDPKQGWCSFGAANSFYNGNDLHVPRTCAYDKDGYLLYVNLWFSIAVGDNWGACVDVPSGNDENGQALQIYECNGTPAQVWRAGLAGWGESDFWIRSNITGLGTNRCWTNWGNVVLYDCAYDF